MTSVAGKRVAIIGDSLSLQHGGRILRNVSVTSPDRLRGVTPGDVFSSWLVWAHAASVLLNAKGGRSAYSFFRSEDGDQQLAELVATRPDIVYVILGTNDLGYNLTTDEQYFRRILGTLKQGGAEVWGIGPPTLPNAERAAEVAAMEHRVYGNKFVDARILTQDLLPGTNARSQDGVHFTTASARILGRRYAEATEILGTTWLTTPVKIALLTLAATAAAFGVAHFWTR